MKVWATKITLRAENKTTETRVINYLTGVLQGDCLSLLLFILSVNLSLGPATLFKKTLAQVFSCKFSEISKNTFFTEHLWATASTHFD